MTTVVKWAAGAIAAALAVSSVVRIADKGLDGNWLGVLFGIVALSMIFTINPDHRPGKPTDKTDAGE